MNIPTLKYERSLSAVRANREVIQNARVEAQAILKVLTGLDEANQALCSHPNKQKRYDPGYAGGGYSHSECSDCGGRLL